MRTDLDPGARSTGQRTAMPCRKRRSLTIRRQDDLARELQQAVCAETGRSRGEILEARLPMGSLKGCCSTH
jgi:hypothetical protein